MKFRGVVATQLDELRLCDARAQQPQERSFEAIVLKSDGPPLRTVVHYAQRWAGRGWHDLLGCQGCGEPSRTLRASGSALLCRRCIPHNTVRHQQKDTKAWRRQQGQEFDALVRSLMKGKSGAAPRRQHELARAIETAEAERVRAAEILTEAALGIMEDS